MKKCISLLLVVVMLLCYIPAGALAAEPVYYVAGVSALCGSNWDPGDANNQMTLNDQGLYEKCYQSVPAGTYEFKVTDGTWNNCWGNEYGNNYSFTTEMEQDIVITFNAETKKVAVNVGSTESYYVAGTASLCGVDWNSDYADNKMSLAADGLYKKTFVNVAAGSHEFKITDGTWNNSWGNADGNNYVFTMEEAQDVTITFNAQTKAIQVILGEATPEEPGEEPEPEEYDITVKVHYYREDAAYSNWEVHMWNGVDTLDSTRKFELENVTYEGTTYGATATYYADAADTWVGFIIKKPDWTRTPTATVRSTFPMSSAAPSMSMPSPAPLWRTS